MSRKKVTESETFFSGLSVRIKKIRGKLSQDEFGKILGVTKATICRYESGRVPNLGMLKMIADYGEVTVEWLLHGELKQFAQEFKEHAPEAYAAGLSDLEIALLTEIITAVEEVLAGRRLKFTPVQRARLIVRAYDDCRAQHQHPSTYQVERLLLLVD